MIKESRIKKGLSQKELALRLGMKQPDVCSIEKGKKNITLETLTLLCKALDIRKIELW
jgi:transcriptional regulator with XRE-family HTH domain